MAYAHQPSHLRAFVTAQKFGSAVHFTLLATNATIQATEQVALPEGFQQLRKPGDTRFIAFTTQKADAALAAMAALGWRVEMAEEAAKPTPERTPAPRPAFPARAPQAAHTLTAQGLASDFPWAWIRTAILAARAHLQGADITCPDATLPTGRVEDGVLTLTGEHTPLHTALGDDRTTHNRTAEDTLVDVWALTLLAPSTGITAQIRAAGLVLAHQGRDVAVLERRPKGWVGTIANQAWAKPLEDYRAILEALHTRRVGRSVQYGVRCAKTKTFFQGWDGDQPRFGAQPHPTALHKRLDRCIAFVDAHSVAPVATTTTPDAAWADLPRLQISNGPLLGRKVEIVAIDRVDNTLHVIQDADTLARRACARTALATGLDARLGTAACAAALHTAEQDRTDLTTLVAVRPAPGCPKATSGIARLPISAALRQAGLSKDAWLGVKTTLPQLGAEMWSIALSADDVDTFLQALPPHSVVAVAPLPHVA